MDEAVALQEAAGLDVITDGEMRRYAFYGHLVEALEGFDKYAGWSITFRDGEGHEATLKRPVVVDKLQWRRQMAVEEFTYLRGRTRAQVEGDAAQRAAGGGLLRPRTARRAPTRPVMPISPISSTSRGARSTELRRLGCEYVQIDAPQYAALLDEKMREGYRQRGSDPDKMLDANIELDNAIIDGHPGMTFGIHICRGNHKSMFYASGGYDRIAAHVFTADAVRSLPARVRRRALGHVRAAEARARRSRGRAGADQLEGAAARIGSAAAGTDRGGVEDRAARAARAQPAVRVRLDPRGQPAVGGRSAQEAGAGRTGVARAVWG